MKEYKYTTSFTYEGHRYKVRANSKKELGIKQERKLTELRTKRQVLSGDMTLSAWADKCIATYKTNQSQATREKFIQRVDHTILTPLGDHMLKTIHPMEVQQVMNEQAGCSRTQINEVYYALRFLFKYAYQNHLIESDPTEGLTKPKIRKQEHRRALTPEERRYFLSVGESDRRYYLFLLMLLCGCRPAEAAECQGRDLSSKNGIPMLHVRGTKTVTADRYVPVPLSFYHLIQSTGPYEYIACTSSGHKIDPDQRRRIWRSYLRQINIAMGCKMYRNQLVPPYPLAPDLVPYCLRHEYCTDLARKGVDIRIAQKLMGHSSITLTANIYTNLMTDDLTYAAEILGAVPEQKEESAVGVPSGVPGVSHLNDEK